MLRLLTFLQQFRLVWWLASLLTQRKLTNSTVAPLQPAQVRIRASADHFAATSYYQRLRSFEVKSLYNLNFSSRVSE